jgi:hypothetical protein
MTLDLEKLVCDLESRAKDGDPRALKREVEASLAEASDASPEIIDRLDMLLISLTEASRDVCRNTKCPHYSKNCSMR